MCAVSDKSDLYGHCGCAPAAEVYMPATQSVINLLLLPPRAICLHADFTSSTCHMLRMCQRCTHGAAATVLMMFQSQSVVGSVLQRVPGGEVPRGEVAADRHRRRGPPGPLGHVRQRLFCEGQDRRHVSGRFPASSLLLPLRLAVSCKLVHWQLL